MDKEKIVCRCFKVSAGDIESAYNEGAKTFEEIQEKTSCGTGCGCCEDDVLEIIEELNR